MPIPNQLLVELEELNYYHLICKSIGQKKLFLNDGNRKTFLRRYQSFINPFIDTFSYCLLDNHVHHLLQPKSVIDIQDYLLGLSPEKLTVTHRRFLKSADPHSCYHELLEQQFNRLYISYALFFNLRQRQSGHLFLRPFKRIEIKNEAHLAQVLLYIHTNPVKHGVTDNFETYKWSSYRGILSSEPSWLKTQEAIGWFGNREQFIKAHRWQADFYKATQWNFE